MNMRKLFYYIIVHVEEMESKQTINVRNVQKRKSISEKYFMTETRVVG